MTTGVNLAMYRAYDPELGRWLSRDPLRNSELRLGPNLYEYVGNDPVYWMDPYGLYRLSQQQQNTIIGGTAAIGGLIGALGGLGMGGGPEDPLAVALAGEGAMQGATLGAGLGLSIVIALQAAGNGGEDDPYKEKMKQGDNSDVNKKARDAAKEAELDDEECEIFHDLIHGQHYTYQEMLDLAYDIKAGIY